MISKCCEESNSIFCENVAKFILKSYTYCLVLLSDMDVSFGLFPELFLESLLQIFSSSSAEIMLQIDGCTFLFPIHFITVHAASLFFEICQYSWICNAPVWAIAVIKLYILDLTIKLLAGWELFSVV